jgi:hypothetical protein
VQQKVSTVDETHKLCYLFNRASKTVDNTSFRTNRLSPIFTKTLLAEDLDEVYVCGTRM